MVPAIESVSVPDRGLWMPLIQGDAALALTTVAIALERILQFSLFQNAK